MATLEPQSIRAFGVNGVIRPQEVDDYLIPEGSVTEVQNFHFDRKGAATVRPGVSTIVATVTTTDVYPCVGLHNSQSSALLAVFSGAASSKIYVFESNNWTTLGLTGGTASVKIRFFDFGSYTIGLNFFYNTLSSMVVYPARIETGSYFATTHRTAINPQNMWGYNPQFGETWKSKAYVAGDPNYPSRLFSSSVISSAGVITWSPTTDFVDVNPGDGEDTSGLKRYATELILFKPNYMYRFRTSGIDPDPLVKIGTRSHESIVEGKKGLYFHHDSGFYRYTGGYPEELSRPISDFILAIPFSQYKEITAWKDDDHIYWSVGNLTISETLGAVLWKNVVLRYTESSQVWTIYSYARDVRRAGPFVTNTTRSVVVGTDNGVVGTFNYGLTDFGDPIKYRVVTKWYEWEGMETRKKIQTLMTICEKARDAHLQYQVDDDMVWQEAGQMNRFINFFTNINVQFRRIRFKITGVSNDEAMIFRGIEVLEGTNDGLVKNL